MTSVNTEAKIVNIPEVENRGKFYQKIKKLAADKSLLYEYPSNKEADKARLSFYSSFKYYKKKDKNFINKVIRIHKEVKDNKVFIYVWLELK